MTTKKQKILFLDRDGVINKDPEGYFCDYNKIEYNYDLLDFVKNNYHDYLKVIVTNQSGISRGYYSVLDFKKLMNVMVNDLDEYGIKINDVKYSIGTNNYDMLRKPNPGMLLLSINKYNVEPTDCVMIGDKESDLLASEKAKIGSFIMYKEGMFKKE